MNSKASLESYSHISLANLPVPAQRNLRFTRTLIAKWRENLGVTYEHLSYEMGFWNVEGSFAYAVLSGALTVTIKGHSVVRTGTLAYTFANRDGVWKIEAQAWGRTS